MADDPTELAPAPEATRAQQAAEALGHLAARFDSWLNAIIGFGGVKDKTAFTAFGTCVDHLSDPQLTAMFRSEDMSRKGVTIYPTEALKKGWIVTGHEREQEEDVTDFLKPYDLLRLVYAADVWGRLYGRGAIWVGTNGAPEAPWQPGETVLFLRVLDKRYLTTSGRTEDLGLDGEPTMYQLSPPEGMRGVVRIHASRLILFGGALTDDLTRRSRDMCDDSVLQVAYDKLKTDGSIWKSAELLVSEASIGVTKIKGLWAMVGGGQRALVEERVRMANMAASVARSKVLDAEGEDYTRVNTTFAGLSDLTDGAVQRVASAFEVPVTVLLGQAPAGLNATGASDLEWLFGRIEAYQRNKLQPLVERLLQQILAQPESPMAGRWREVGLTWPEIRTATAKEKAEVYSLLTAADGALIASGVVTPQEVALGRFTPDGFATEWTLDDDQRDLRVEADADAGDTGEPGDAEAVGLLGATGEDEAGVQLSPAVVEAVVTVNEARKALRLGELEAADGSGPDANGKLTVTAFKALAASTAETAAGSQPELGGVPEFDPAKAEEQKAAEQEAKLAALDGGKGGGFGAAGDKAKAEAPPPGKRADGGDWDESKHPRAADGKFGAGGGLTAKDKASLMAARSEYDQAKPGSAKARAREKHEAGARKVRSPKARAERHEAAKERQAEHAEKVTAAKSAVEALTKAIDETEAAAQKELDDYKAETTRLRAAKTAAVKQAKAAAKAVDKVSDAVREEAGEEADLPGEWESEKLGEARADLITAKADLAHDAKEFAEFLESKAKPDEQGWIADGMISPSRIPEVEAQLRGYTETAQKQLAKAEAALAEVETNLAELLENVPEAHRETYAKWVDAEARVQEAQNLLDARETPSDPKDRLAEAKKARKHLTAGKFSKAAEALDSEFDGLPKSPQHLAKLERHSALHQRDVERTAKRLTRTPRKPKA